MSAGNGGFSAGMGGMPPGTFGLFGFDTVTGSVLCAPLGSCPLGLTLSATLTLITADPAGDIFLPLSLAGAPIGSFLNSQNVAFCATLPVGFAFSRLQTIAVGGF
ncbi:MAG: hypothetical protein ACI89X_001840 [Planctomycetota bacterium]|jgi:hypothetical protein